MPWSNKQHPGSLSYRLFPVQILEWHCFSRVPLAIGISLTVVILASVSTYIDVVLLLVGSLNSMVSPYRTQSC